MLDLIIPVYKNRMGLYRSLFSIGTEVGDKVYVTVVDDCSGEKYDDVIECFQKFFPIRVVYQEKNMGPGIARQRGLDMASQPYVAFLDCGDVYASPTKLLECLNEVEINPHTVMFSWAHTEEKYTDEQKSRHYEYESFPPSNNRMHGKIYRRDFLMQYGIKFCEEGSRMNEDIGFNIPIRIISEHLWRRDGIQRIWHSEEIAVVWKVNGPSIVRADNCAFYFRDQNVGMSINGRHILNLVRKNNVDQDLILTEIYEEMTHMYMFYCSTRNVRPEYLDSCIRGAASYYLNCFKEHAEDDLDLLTRIHWSTVAHFLSDVNDPVRMKFYPIDFPEFLNMLEKYCQDNDLRAIHQEENGIEAIDNGFSYNAN